MAMPEPVKRNDIKNSTVRVWTKAQLKETKAQCKANGFIVSKIGFGGAVTVVDPTNDNLVLKAMEGRPGMMMVRINQTYFEA